MIRPGGQEMMMEKTTPTVRPPGLHNDFSEQEQTMTASAMPPKFALTANSATPDNTGNNGRKAVPFAGFGGDLEFDEDRTTTVLGRCVEGATKEDMIQNVDQPLGTNYFRYQPEFMVGKNKGGGNVLDVADRTWTWPLNNAWLQASLDRGDRIRFISDPKDPTTLYREGDPEKGPTITGQELAVLMHKGYAPNESSGEVRRGYRPSDKKLWIKWRKIEKEVISKRLHKEIDTDAYAHFLHGSQSPELAPKKFRTPTGEIVATQKNFFGGQPAMKAVS